MFPLKLPITLLLVLAPSLTFRELLTFTIPVLLRDLTAKTTGSALGVALASFLDSSTFSFLTSSCFTT